MRGTRSVCEKLSGRRDASVVLLYSYYFTPACGVASQEARETGVGARAASPREGGFQLMSLLD